MAAGVSTDRSLCVVASLVAVSASLVSREGCRCGGGSHSLPEDSGSDCTPLYPGWSDRLAGSSQDSAFSLVPVRYGSLVSDEA